MKYRNRIKRYEWLKQKSKDYNLYSSIQWLKIHYNKYFGTNFIFHLVKKHVDSCLVVNGEYEISMKPCAGNHIRQYMLDKAVPDSDDMIKVMQLLTEHLEYTYNKYNDVLFEYAYVEKTRNFTIKLKLI